MKATARAAVSQLGNLDAEIAELFKMNVSELIGKYRELYGEPTRSRNKSYLQKRLAWRVQELREGGLAPRAIELIATLGDEVPERWRQLAAEAAPPRVEPRDPRLPPVGTRLSKIYRGKEHSVTICSDGIEYQGKRFGSLSAVAKQITGTAWNGYAFFGVAASPERTP